MGFFDFLKTKEGLWITDIAGRFEKETGQKVAMGVVPISTVPFLPKSVISKAGSVLKAFGKAIIPKTLRGKIFAGTTALIGYGVVKESPIAKQFVTEKVKDIPKIPGKLVSFGGDVGQVIEGEKTFGKEDILKSVAKAGIVGGAVAGAIYVAPKIIEKVKEMKKEKEKAMGDEKASGVVSSPAGGTSPILPETQIVTPTRKPTKRRRAKKTPSVRQSVRINIINKPVGFSSRITNKRYINNELLN